MISICNYGCDFWKNENIEQLLTDSNDDECINAVKNIDRSKDVIPHFNNQLFCGKKQTTRDAQPNGIIGII